MKENDQDILTQKFAVQEDNDYVSSGHGDIIMPPANKNKTGNINTTPIWKTVRSKVRNITRTRLLVSKEKKQIGVKISNLIMST